MSLSRWFPALRARLRAFFGRGRLERELDSELRFHLDQQIAEHVERGLPTGEARRRALAAFGGVDVIKEMSRDQWASRLLDRSVRETRHAVRMLRRSPGFTLGAVLSLGLGLGLTALMLSVANAYLWRPLPVPDAPRPGGRRTAPSSRDVCRRTPAGPTAARPPPARSPQVGRKETDDSRRARDDNVIGRDYFTAMRIPVLSGGGSDRRGGRRASVVTTCR